MSVFAYYTTPLYKCVTVTPSTSKVLPIVLFDYYIGCKRQPNLDLAIRLHPMYICSVKAPFSLVRSESHATWSNACVILRSMYLKLHQTSAGTTLNLLRLEVTQIRMVIMGYDLSCDVAGKVAQVWKGPLYLCSVGLHVHYIKAAHSFRIGLKHTQWK